MSEKVAIVKVHDNLRDALQNAINLIGGFDVKDGEKVVIKPNLSDLVDSEKGVTTSVELVEEMISIIKGKADTEIAIVESDHWVTTADEEFDKLGYVELGEKYGVRLVNISHDQKIPVMLDGAHFKSINVPQTLLECNKFVSMANLKTHSAEKISCILKNQFGLITKRYKSEYHPFMSKVLADLNSLYKPDLCIIDGRISLEGSGPTFGKPKKTGLIICGKDPIAVDFVAAEVMGFNPRKVPHLKFAADSDGGIYTLDDIEIVGEELSNVKLNFEFIPFLKYMSVRLDYALIRLGASLSNLFAKFAKYHARARAVGPTPILVRRLVRKVAGRLYILYIRARALFA